ncbi:hypothetical protein AAY473_039376 [Plecturocebus cupreus]
MMHRKKRSLHHKPVLTHMHTPAAECKQEHLYHAAEEESHPSKTFQASSNQFSAKKGPLTQRFTLPRTVHACLWQRCKTTWEAEVGELLEPGPGRRELPSAEITPLHSSLRYREFKTGLGNLVRTPSPHLYRKYKIEPGVVVHTCSPSCSGGRSGRMAQAQEDAKNGSNGHKAIDVGRSIKGIKTDHINMTPCPLALNRPLPLTEEDLETGTWEPAYHEGLW